MAFIVLHVVVLVVLIAIFADDEAEMDMVKLAVVIGPSLLAIRLLTVSLGPAAIWVYLGVIFIELFLFFHCKPIPSLLISSGFTIYLVGFSALIGTLSA